jgi:hypothetical protein
MNSPRVPATKKVTKHKAAAVNIFATATLVFEEIGSNREGGEKGIIRRCNFCLNNQYSTGRKKNNPMNPAS